MLRSQMQIESFEHFELSCRWRRELVQRSQDQSIHDGLEQSFSSLFR